MKLSLSTLCLMTVMAHAAPAEEKSSPVEQLLQAAGVEAKLAVPAAPTGGSAFRRPAKRNKIHGAGSGKKFRRMVYGTRAHLRTRGYNQQFRLRLLADETGAACMLVQQLRDDPGYASAYSAQIDLYDGIPSGPGSMVDILSADCLGCHDGVIAGEVQVRLCGTDYVKDEHPIGCGYYAGPNQTPAYNPPGQLLPNMRFIQGKLGCLSCHDPFDQAGDHLVGSNDASALCFTCHRK